MTTFIKNGTLITTTGAAPTDVLIEGETIAALFAPDSPAGTSAADGAGEVLDADGLYVVPGGVDGHTHMDLPFGDTVSSDDFASGTRAAAHGGTTTIVDFAVQRAGEDVREGLEAWFAKADGKCAVDYGFHQIIGDVNEVSLEAMDALVAEGVTSMKLFMAYPGVYLSDDGQILRAMQRAADNGALIMMHAENGLAIDVLAEQAVARGATSPVNHGRVRRVELEAEATHRAIQLARVAGAPLYIVHLSCSEALDEVVAARDRGANVFAETCPHYLYLNLEDHLDRPGFEGAAFVCSTPLRTRTESHHEDLWRGLRTNDLSVVATDHCPFCMKEQKEAGIDDFRRIPNGIGGVEHRLDLLHQGVVTGEISLPRWVELCATTPARMFGLYPRKGVLQPGSDADVVLYDPEERWTIGVDTHHMNIDHSAFEGMEVQGRVRTVLLRGEVIVDDGEYVGRQGDGRYQPRGLSDYLL